MHEPVKGELSVSGMYSGPFRVVKELRPSGELWFWVVGHGFCIPAKDEEDARRLLESKTKEWMQLSSKHT